MIWIWRDNKDDMWLGDIPLNDISELSKYKMRWKINNKTATIAERRAEWVAVKNTFKGFKVDKEFFRNLTVLYF